MKFKITPFRFYISPPASDDKKFYFGPSWSMAGKLIGGGKFDIFGTRLTIWKFNLIIGSIEESNYNQTPQINPQGE